MFHESMFNDKQGNMTYDVMILYLQPQFTCTGTVEIRLNVRGINRVYHPFSWGHKQVLDIERKILQCHGQQN